MWSQCLPLLVVATVDNPETVILYLQISMLVICFFIICAQNCTLLIFANIDFLVFFDHNVFLGIIINYDIDGQTGTHMLYCSECNVGVSNFKNVSLWNLIP